MRVLTTMVVVLLLVLVVAVATMYSGMYDVTALKPHGKMFTWMANMAVDRAVRKQAKAITVPSLNDPMQVARGFLHYHEMCVICHGAPGVLHSELAEGMYPPPPDLTKAVPDWTPAELYWIIKTGFKDTGMPAFGPTHDEQSLWAITAFTLRLPTMSAGQYDSLRMAAGLPKAGEHDEDDEIEGKEHDAPDAGGGAEGKY